MKCFVFLLETDSTIIYAEQWKMILKKFLFGKFIFIIPIHTRRCTVVFMYVLAVKWLGLKINGRINNNQCLNICLTPSLSTCCQLHRPSDSNLTRILLFRKFSAFYYIYAGAFLRIDAFVNYWMRSPIVLEYRANEKHLGIL